jgi:hypothetical protein
MSENIHPEPTTPPQRNISSLQSIIEERLAQAQTSEEISLWISERERILKQDNFLKDEDHRRNLEKRQIVFRMVMSFSAIPVGVALLYQLSPFYPGTSVPGLFILGLAFYSLAPDFIKGFFSKGNSQ